MSSREINTAIPVTLFLIISITLYGFYDNLSGDDEGSDLDLVDPVWDCLLYTSPSPRDS